MSDKHERIESYIGWLAENADLGECIVELAEEVGQIEAVEALLQFHKKRVEEYEDVQGHPVYDFPFQQSKILVKHLEPLVIELRELGTITEFLENDDLVTEVTQ